MKRWEAWLNHAGWGMAVVTGLAYGVLKYFGSNPDPNSRLPHPWASPALSAHVLAAPVALFAVGLIFRRHALVRLRSGQAEGRATGRALTLLVIPLAMSGYVLQVLTGDPARRSIGYAHAGAGLLFAILYLWHPRGSRATRY